MAHRELVLDNLPSRSSTTCRPLPRRLVAHRLAARRLVACRFGVALFAAALVTALAACGPTGPTGVPTAPRGVAATAIAGGVRVTWLDQSSNEEGFVVLRKDAAAAGLPSKEVGRTGADEQAFNDFSTEAGGSYLYAMASFNVVGESEPVLQEPAEPVSPQPGVEVSVTFDGDGVVVVSGGVVMKVCVSDCRVAFAAGSDVTLTAQSSEGAVFAGWTGACSGADSCELTVDEPLEVEARFRRHVLQLSLDGDSPVRVTMFPGDDFGTNVCRLDPGGSCTLAYGFAGPLAVSITAVKLEADGEFLGYEGCPTEPGMYCIANVSGATPVVVKVIHPPVAAPEAYEVNEDGELDVNAGSGVLANDTDSPGDTLTAVLASEPADGELDLAADGSFSYEPETNFNGSDSFTYRARDAYGNESAAVAVTVSVRPVNDPPVFSLTGDVEAGAGNGALRTIPGFASGMGVGGGSDEAGQALTGFTISRVGDGLPRMAMPQIDLDGTLTFQPPPFSSGSATYEVTLSDDGGTANQGADTSAPQRFTITVSGFRLDVNVEGSGTVSIEPASDDGSYGYGTPVSLTAAPATDYAFGTWQGDCSSTVPACQVTMEVERSVTARFDPVVRVRFAADIGFFAVQSSPAGIANCWSIFPDTGNCDAAFAEATVLTLQTTTSGLHQFQGVACADGEPATVCTFTVTAPVIVTVAGAAAVPD
ncbi:MAG TPA: Ig-like domain-containing protein [Trueperaceae bacterium]|nr:Ig-like domain-containing protein [Trueperaceae bacterium]